MSATVSGVVPGASEETLARVAQKRVQRYRRHVTAGRIGLLILIVGAWQLLTDYKIVDPFFAGSPVGVVSRLFDWFMNGTAYGPFWLQIWITMEEALLGFGFGVVSGVIAGVVLGEIPI